MIFAASRNSLAPDSARMRPIKWAWPLLAYPGQCSHHTTLVSSSGYSRVVKESAAMMVRKSLVYERRKSVANTATGLALPISNLSNCD